jgi:hypothetical protein
MTVAKEKKPMPKKRTTKRTTQIIAARPMTGAEASDLRLDAAPMKPLLTGSLALRRRRLNRSARES